MPRLRSAVGNAHSPEVCQTNNTQITGIPVRISARHDWKVINHRNSANLVYVNINNDQQCKLRPNMRFALWNSRSINKKAAIICDIIQSNKLDILAVTETWSNKSTEYSSVAEVLNIIKDFAVLEAPRLTGRGGGVAVFIRKSLKITKYSELTFRSFEHLDLSVTHGNFNIRMLIVYRPPPSKKNKLTSTIFFTDFSNFIEDLTVFDKPFFIAGDFNLHIDNKSNLDTIKFLNILDCTNMVQMVSGPTHRRGHTLDLIITQRDEELIGNVDILQDTYSDHRVVTCELKCPKPPLSKVLVSYRSTKHLDPDTLKYRIKKSFSDYKTSDVVEINELVNIYNESLKNIYDELCPIQTRKINYRPWAPWYNDDLRAIKREKRRLERKKKKSGLTVDKQLFTEACEKYNKMLESYKTSYYKDKIDQADRSKLFRLVNGLFQKNSKVLPSYTSLETLAEEFNDFFINKIRKIRNELELYKENIETNIAFPLPKQSACKFGEFHLPSDSSVQEIIKSLSKKTCSLDPIPTHVLKNHLESLTPMITNVVRTSLSEGVFPNTLKMSHVGPRLKKPDLDKDLFLNFRPIANIAFLSKVIEKTAAIQTQAHLDTNNLYPSFQSAYRQFHSTETALLKVTNDILRTLDKHQDVILVLLDLSSAFDTLDHDILLARLESYFKFSDKVLKWFRSYLTGRSQSIVIGDVVSSLRQLEYGVPQGSILGPLLFTLYIAPLQDVISKYDLDFMFYADDCELYVTINPKNPSTSYETLRSCINEVILWNTENMLLCNPGKTEVLHLSSRFKKHQNLQTNFSFANTTVEVSDKVINLGTVFDKNLTLSSHINETCKKAISNIKSIGRIRKYLSKDDLKRLVNALVISRLDYANSILYGVPKYELDKLQRVQNAAARLITGKKKFDHITPALMELHWLPIEYRINFKIILLVYRSLHGLAPDYLRNIIEVQCPARALRSSHRSLLSIPKIYTATYGKRAYSHAAPELWNSIPDHIKNAESILKFKSSLKTYLFKKAYDC